MELFGGKRKKGEFPGLGVRIIPRKGRTDENGMVKRDGGRRYDNIVLVCDVSGSMTQALVDQEFSCIVKEIADQAALGADKSIVSLCVCAFNNAVKKVCDWNDPNSAAQSMEHVHVGCNGQTDLEKAVSYALDTLEAKIQSQKDEGHAIGRQMIIVLTDGKQYVSGKSGEISDKLVSRLDRSGAYRVIIGMGDTDRETIRRLKGTSEKYGVGIRCKGDDYRDPKKFQQIAKIIGHVSSSEGANGSGEHIVRTDDCTEEFSDKVVVYIDNRNFEVIA